MKKLTEKQKEVVLQLIDNVAMRHKPAIVQGFKDLGLCNDALNGLKSLLKSL